MLKRNSLTLLFFVFAPFQLMVLAGLLAAGEVSAQTLPYRGQVDSFSVPERGLFDGFDDGSIDGTWSSILGTVSESGTTLDLSNPGASGFLPAGVDNETSVASGAGVGLDFSGDLTATTTWIGGAPGSSIGFNFSLGSINPVNGNVHQLSIGVSRISTEVAAVLGGAAGLSVSVLDVVRDSPPGDILSLERTSFAITEAEVTGDLLFQLVFDDTANTLTPRFSLDGGATIQSPFAAKAWNFTGGGFSISAGSTVPEPGTALLLGLGLGLLGVRKRN